MLNFEKEKKKIIQRYNDKLETQDGSDLLSTGNSIRRDIRYQVLTEIGNFSNKKVLDLGCGTGDLYKYLRSKNIVCEYFGYDLNPNVIEMAQKKYPDANFEVKDILEEEFPEFDYIVSSSSFNNKFESIINYKFIEDILPVMYSHARKGVAVDFLTSYVDYKHDFAFYYEPEKIFSISKNITRRVNLRHDYTLFEFCIYLYKDKDFPYGK